MTITISPARSPHLPGAAVPARWHADGRVLGATVLFWLSLTPSLLPRTWVIQGLVSGVVAAHGYALGRLVRCRVPRPVVAGGALASVLFGYLGWVAQQRLT